MAKEFDVKAFDKAIVDTLTYITDEYENQVDVDVNVAGMIISKCAYFASLVKEKLFKEDVLSSETFVKEALGTEE